MVKSPKVYIRDSWILHSLIKVDSTKELFGHPVFGNSFEGFVLEPIISSFPRWQFYFYRTRSGAEIDLLMIKGARKVAVEIKAGKSPILKKGFWTAAEGVKAKEEYLIAPVDSAHTIKGNIKVTSLFNFLKKIS